MSRRDKKRSSDESPAGEWLTTYSDLVTLLLCFFVLLFSFSEVDANKFRQISQSFKIGFEGSNGILNGGEAIDIEEPPIGGESKPEIEDELMDLYKQLKKYASDQDLEDELSVQLDERGVLLSFADNVFFDSGSADIKPESREILDATASILKQDEFSKRQIKIEGHTDSDRIVYSTKYATNWELSSARATNVLRYLVEVDRVEADRISSAGYSEYRPVAENDTVENKAKNRRVDIVILKDVYEKFEPGGVK